MSVFPVRTPTLPPATHTNAYALGQREVLLVEPATPYEDEKRAYVEWARGIAAQGRKIVGIFATHHHDDHVGGLDDLARELGLSVWMHRETASRVATSASVRLLNHGETIRLDGPVSQEWTVLHTPGHAIGHLCLHNEAADVLVVGDMVASVGSILIAPGEGDMAVYLEQLRQLSTMGASLALPAHGLPIEDPRAVFEWTIQRRLMREQKIVAAFLTHDTMSEDSLLEKTYDDTPREVWPVARLSLQAHLEKLFREKRVFQRDGMYSESPFA